MSSSSFPSDVIEETESSRYRLENAPTIKKNVSLALKQAVCWAIMFGISDNIFSLFAIHLNAPLFVYGALIWIPGFLGPFIQILSSNILDTYNQRVKLIYTSVFLQAFCFIPLVIIALWPSAEITSDTPKEMNIFIYIYIICFFLFNMGGQFSSPPWQSLVGDLVSKHERGSFFAKMSRANQFFSLASMIFVSYVLYYVGKNHQNDAKVLSYVFAGCFFISFVARLCSGMFIKKMTDTPYQTPLNSVFTFWQFIKRAPESNFVKFVIFSAAVNMGACIAGPYFINYWINVIGHTKSEWIMMQCFGTVASILTLMFWGRFSDLFGNKQTLKYSSFVIGLIPFFWLISDNLIYLLCLQMCGVVFWTGFNLSTVNYIYEAASQPKRARCFAYFSLITGIGILIGTQIGLFIENNFSEKLFGCTFNSAFCWVLIASGIVRLSACAAFLKTFKELREVKAFDLNAFWIDVLQVRTLFGISLVDKNDTDSKN